MPEEPTFEEYVAARKVVLYVYEGLRREKYKGHLSIASDEMVAQIILKSCERYRMPAKKPERCDGWVYKFSGYDYTGRSMSSLVPGREMLFSRKQCKRDAATCPEHAAKLIVESGITDVTALGEILRSQAKVAT